MPVRTIPTEALVRGLPASPEQAREWCSLLESGGILYFPETPLPIPEEDLAFLLQGQQTGSSLHKNIAYKPDRDRISGVDKTTASADDLARLQDVMRRYSRSVAEYLAGFLAP